MTDFRLVTLEIQVLKVHADGAVDLYVHFFDDDDLPVTHRDGTPVISANHVTMMPGDKLSLGPMKDRSKDRSW